MKQAVLAALRRDPAQPEPLTLAALADLPADGRSVTVRVDGADMTPVLQDGAAPSVVDLHVRDDLYKIRSVHGCPSHALCNAELSWDRGKKGRARATAEHGDPVLWRITP